jgi:hypothetical protein
MFGLPESLERFVVESATDFMKVISQILDLQAISTKIETW